MREYLVGGAVRDLLMNKSSSDRDYVVVGATEDDMKRLGFSKIGHSFPVFLHPITGDEWALARTEKKDGIGHGGFTAFTHNVTLVQDLQRRDLTINAMAQSPVTGEIIDPYDGQQDIKNKVLRHVSDAFSEDPLRVIRLARFYSRFTDFSIALKTISLAQKITASGEMNLISSERYLLEMLKVIESKEGDPLRFFEALNLFGVLDTVDFFKKLLGTVSCKSYVTEIVGHRFRAAKKIFGDVPDMALLCAIASTSNSDADLSAVPNDIKKAHESFNKMLSITEIISAEDIFQLLSFCRATSKMSSSLTNLLSTMYVVESTGINFLVSSKKLKNFASMCHEVSSGTFIQMGLSGKELGIAMDIEKMNRIHNSIKNNF